MLTITAEGFAMQ